MDTLDRIKCDCCGNYSARLVNTILIYDKEHEIWPFAWHCNTCDAVVNCHPNSTIPMGRLANRQTRNLRRKAHLVFDKLWRYQIVSRDDAYYILAKRLNINYEDCHIGMLSNADLLRVIALAPEINAVIKPHLHAIEEEKEHERRRTIENREHYKKYRAIKRKCKKRNRRK